MTKRQQKIAQYKKDIESLQKNLRELEAEEGKKMATVPIVSIADCDVPRDRVIIRLSEMAMDRINQGSQVVVLDGSGYVTTDRTDRFDELGIDAYSNITPVFGELKNG